jgi:prepilin-type processing-associated H-X9-DG protein
MSWSENQKNQIQNPNQNQMTKKANPKQRKVLFWSFGILDFEIVGDLSPRLAWTRIELLVVVVLILTAAGAVLTVLQRVQDPAQRIECAMHLERMGKAVHSFHDQQKTLPASCLAPSYATWAVEIAPFLPKEDGKALKEWDLGLSFFVQPAEIREGQVGNYYCPARRAGGMVSVSGDVNASGADPLTNIAGALGDYGCAPTSDNAAKPWTSPEADGALIVGEVLEKIGSRIVRWKSRTTLASLLRGQAYTILLGEKHVPIGGFGQRELGDGSLYNGEFPASFARLVDAQHPLAQGPGDPFNLNFGSWHPGICQFLMADGHVQISGNSVDPEVLQKLVPRGLPD